MIFSTNAKTFQNSVLAVAKNTIGKSMLPYGMITIAAENGKITVSSIEPHSYMAADITDADIQEEGQVSLNTAKLTALMKEIKADTFTISCDNKQCTIKSNNEDIFHLAIYNEDIPSWVDENMAISLTFKGNEFNEIITKTSSINKNLKMADELEMMNNPCLGFNLIIDKNILKLQAATPEKSVAAKFSKMLDTDTGNCNITVPYSFVKTTSDIKNDEDTTIYIGKKNIVMVKGNITLKSILYAGKGLPDISRIIPTKYDSEVLVDRRELINAVKICNIAEKNLIYITTDKDKRQILLHSADDTMQLNRSISVMIDRQTASKVLTKINGKNLINILNAFDCEEIKLNLNPNNPCIIKDEEDDRYTFVIAPMKG